MGVVRTYIYTDTYIYIYIYDIYIYVRFRLQTECVVFSGSLPIGGSVTGKCGVAHIAAHSSPTGLREVALPERVLVDGGVMFSYRCSRDRKYVSQILIGLRRATGG